MWVQCVVCRRVRADGAFRLPWPGELAGEDVAETYCPRCAGETLSRIQRGEFERATRRDLARRAAHGA